MNSKINVMHMVGDMSLGGAAKLIKFDVENANSDEFNMSVCCLGLAGEYGQELISKGYSVESFGLSRSWRNLIKNLNGLIKSFNFIRKQNIDVINSHLFLPGIIGRIFGKILNIPSMIHTTHNIMYPRMEPIINRVLEKYTDITVVDSNAVKNKLINAGQKGEKISVIYNGIDEKEFDQECDPLKIRQQLGITPEDIVIGNIAGFQHYKGHDFLLEVFTKLVVKHKNLHLMLVGDGELRQKLVFTTKQKNIYERVHFLGFRKDIPPLILSMDIMVHPSRWEGFGIILAEAMYCSIPIVASDRGGIPEVVEDGVCGYVHSFGDVDSFIQSISGLINNQQLRRRFGENGKKRVKEKFTMERMTENYSNIYKTVLQGKNIENR